MRNALITIPAAAVVFSVSMASHQASGTLDVPGINQVLTQQGDAITTLQSQTNSLQNQVNQNSADIQSLQQSTNTPPAQNVVHVDLPAPSAAPVPQTTPTSPTPTPPPPVVTITAADPYLTVPDPNQPLIWQDWCNYTYSDGTSRLVEEEWATPVTGPFQSAPEPKEPFCFQKVGDPHQ